MQDKHLVSQSKLPTWRPSRKASKITMHVTNQMFE